MRSIRCARCPGPGDRRGGAGRRARRAPSGGAHRRHRDRGHRRERRISSCDPRHSARMPVVQQACPLLVPLCRGRLVRSPGRRAGGPRIPGPAARPPASDPSVLGCTHYPLAQAAAQPRAGPGVTLIDSAEEVAAALAETLAAGDSRPRTISSPRHRFAVSDDPSAICHRRVRVFWENVSERRNSSD